MRKRRKRVNFKRRSFVVMLYRSRCTVCVGTCIQPAVPQHRYGVVLARWTLMVTAEADRVAPTLAC